MNTSKEEHLEKWRIRHIDGELELGEDALSNIYYYALAASKSKKRTHACQQFPLALFESHSLGKRSWLRTEFNETAREKWEHDPRLNEHLDNGMGATISGFISETLAMVSVFVGTGLDGVIASFLHEGYDAYAAIRRFRLRLPEEFKRKRKRPEAADGEGYQFDDNALQHIKRVVDNYLSTRSEARAFLSANHAETNVFWQASQGWIAEEKALKFELVSTDPSL